MRSIFLLRAFGSSWQTSFRSEAEKKNFLLSFAKSLKHFYECLKTDSLKFIAFPADVVIKKFDCLLLQNYGLHILLHNKYRYLNDRLKNGEPACKS